ncbi:hypothetical protein DB313_06260 (plasmid) [Borrelia turcica IST7]|uniref:Uncharacterized protein n=1 Tax=Borrelia turcica IST7 TaxID=1104446 RepID=A0A386PQY6_9SPIR|nr:DUF1506 family protein [Borrelia turcica]AYE37103.1 hypothetical protein DB313_06260 [Borrelia turcica IST7]
MSAIRQRLASMAGRLVSFYQNDEEIRYYKAKEVYNSYNATSTLHFSKEEYTKIIGIIFNLTDEELAQINDSNLSDIKVYYKMYTSADIAFKVKDRISLENTLYFEIVKVNGGVGYYTLILKELIWK